ISDVHQSRFIKGKIDINQTIRQTNEMIVSEYDEFDLNHELNQILKTYLEKFYYTEIGQKKIIRMLLIHFDIEDSIKLTKNKYKKNKKNEIIIKEYDKNEINHKLKQILKTYLEKFYYTKIGQKKRIRKLLIHFDTVDSINVTKNRSKRINYNRLTIDYQFPIEL